MLSLMVGNPSAYVGEGWVGGNLFVYGSYDVVASGSIVFIGAASRNASKIFNSTGSLEFTGAVSKNILRNFTASGALVFSGDTLKATVRMSSSAWSPENTPDGTVGAGSSVWEESISAGGSIGSSYVGVWG